MGRLKGTAGTHVLWKQVEGELRKTKQDCSIRKVSDKIQMYTDSAYDELLIAIEITTKEQIKYERRLLHLLTCMGNRKVS